jgi:hypothetical protein
MTGTFTEDAKAADKARDRALLALAKVGNEYRSMEEAFDKKRRERDDLMVEVAQSKLLTNETVYITARASRTTLYDALQLARDAAKVE